MSKFSAYKEKTEFHLDIFYKVILARAYNSYYSL